MPERFRGYEVRRERWRVCGAEFDLAWPADMDGLLDAPRTQERFAADEYMPYWAQPWPGAILLAEAVITGPPGRGRRAIEIGCGVGIVSLAAAAAGWEVTATDYDEDAIAFAEWNAARNQLRLAGCALLDYRAPLDAPTYDLVLGSDLLYERKKCEPVARWIASALREGGEALLSDPNRAAAEPFVECALAAGLEVSAASVETISPCGLLTRGRIFRVRQAGQETLDRGMHERAHG